jgi:uncharacterized membrane protein
VFIVFLAVWLAHTAALGSGAAASSGPRWVDAVYLLLATGTVLLGLGRRLPLQNVLIAAALIATICGTVLTLAAFSSLPIGPAQYSERLGARFLHVLPWPLPVLWAVALLSARGVARLILRPWRPGDCYGFWVIGVAGLLAVLFDLAMEPFAVLGNGWWHWGSPKSGGSWYPAPWGSLLGWFGATVASLLLTTPWLINKRPVPRPADHHPLIVWLLLNFTLAVGNAAREFWLAAGVGLVGNVIAAGLALRGARWRKEAGDAGGSPGRIHGSSSTEAASAPGPVVRVQSDG